MRAKNALSLILLSMILMSLSLTQNPTGLPAPGPGSTLSVSLGTPTFGTPPQTLDNIKFFSGTRNVHFYSWAPTKYPGDIKIQLNWQGNAPVTVKAIKSSTGEVVLQKTYTQSPVTDSVPRSAQSLEV